LPVLCEPALVPILDEPLTDVSVPLVWAQDADCAASAKLSAAATTPICFIIWPISYDEIADKLESGIKPKGQPSD